MAVNQYLPWAAGGGANVEDPATYAADPTRTNGHLAGIAPSNKFNTTWRQTSVAVAAIAQKIVDVTGTDMLDDGSVANFEAGFTSMLNLLGGLGSGGIFGLTMSNTPANPTTQVTIQAGQCRDSINSANIILAAPFIKDLTAVWAAGSGNGGRDLATALAAGQTWHLFLIFKPTTNTVDALFSQSPTAPTLPALYTKFRRIGSIMLDPAATTIRQFLQTGDYFMWKVRSADFAAQANGGGVSYLRVITVPNGIKVEAIMYFQSTGTANTTAYLSGIFDPDFGVPAAFGGPNQWAQVRRGSFLDSTSTALSYGTVIARQFTDTSQHVYTFSSDNLDVIALGVVGYRDERGKFF
jgi:hypothetical protein